MGLWCILHLEECMPKQKPQTSGVSFGPSPWDLAVQVSLRCTYSGGNHLSSINNAVLQMYCFSFDSKKAGTVKDRLTILSFQIKVNQ